MHICKFKIKQEYGESYKKKSSHNKSQNVQLKNINFDIYEQLQTQGKLVNL